MTAGVLGSYILLLTLVFSVLSTVVQVTGYTEVDPKDPNTWIHKGNALDESDKHDEALKAYDKAIEINPNHSDAWYNRACLYSHIDNKEQVIFNLKRVIELNSLCKEEAKKDPDFKKLWMDDQFILLVSTVVHAEDILKHIADGDDINLVNCSIVGKLNISNIKLETVPSPYFNKYLGRGNTKELLISLGLKKHLSVVKSDIIITN